MFKICINIIIMYNFYQGYINLYSAIKKLGSFDEINNKLKVT